MKISILRNELKNYKELEELVNKFTEDKDIISITSHYIPQYVSTNPGRSVPSGPELLIIIIYKG